MTAAARRAPTMPTSEPTRCFWATGDPLLVRYHDEEWGAPLHDNRKLFEFLLLDTFQAGLSWMTILRKRENFRRAFHNFEPALIARYTDYERQRLLQDPGIVRNAKKIEAAIINAQRVLEVHQEFGSFDRYIWQFTGHRTLRNPQGVTHDTMRSSSPESDAMARDLKKRGFRFVGTTTCYAFMQAAGMVNDHVDGCFRAGG